MMRLRCALVGTGQQLIACAELLLARGHEIVGVLSDCPLATRWAAGRNVILTHGDSGRTWLDGTSFDYLLSIVNHAILPPALVASAAKGAINYHDSLLPSYAGFNATAWSILEGRATHGVTWHALTGEVDGGAVLVQRIFDIGDDDTAFTLGVKCSEAGIATFATLLDEMEREALSPHAQHGRRSFHLRSDRPGLALVDFSRPVGELHGLVRALNFGPEDNWMATPKVRAPGGYLAIVEAGLGETRTAEPGTVLSITKSGIDVAAEGGALHLTTLASLDGEWLEPMQAATRFGLVQGQRLPESEAALRAKGGAFDASVTKWERFWVERLATHRAATVPEVTPHGDPPSVRVLRRALPTPLADEPQHRRLCVLVGALAACLHRLGSGDTFDVAIDVDVPRELRPFYASAVPLRCLVDAAASFSALVDGVDTELARLDKRRTYARDIWLRYSALREKVREGRALPIGVRRNADACEGRTGEGSELAEGTHLTLIVSGGADYAWAYDAHALPAAAAREFADRFEVLLAAALTDADKPVRALPIVSGAERELMLTAWQQTARPYDADLCVHECFERQVERTPDATAAVYAESELTYRALNERANRLAHELQSAGVGPESLVGISVDRSLDLLVGLLGILKAGGAYVPLDPAYPSDRLAMMLEDSKARFVVTQSHLVERIPKAGAKIVLVDGPTTARPDATENPRSGVGPRNLAYVMFTSGSTGRPKGTMVEHRNVANFFAGMDAVIGEKAGVWLAVTSISFDISVLELFWTLARGFEVVIAPETDRASLTRRAHDVGIPVPRMDFGLFYFAADSGTAPAGNAYRLLIEGAKFADDHGFVAVWTPERHFHAFGGLYPNPAVTTAALSTITSRVQLRAGSVVLPLHNPLRVAEDWAVIDQLSGGRVGLSFASGWHVNDFAFMPENFARRREVMVEHIETVLKLWSGQRVSVRNGAGQSIEVAVLPRPVQARPPIWIASAGTVDTFILAGRLGANILTNMLGQDLADLKEKFAAYRSARREHGHDGDGIISVMLHTFVTDDTETARQLARGPFSAYLASSFDLVKVAPRMFPAFRQPSRSAADAPAIDRSAYTPEDMTALLDHAFDRYFETAGLFGTPERALTLVERLAGIGANELACLIDFGIDPDQVLSSLTHLHRLQELCRDRSGRASAPAVRPQHSLAEQIRRRRVTHLQCTPSMARTLADDPGSLAALADLDKLMLGGEALPTDLADHLSSVVRGDVLNMYGPTETTIWSTTSLVTPGTPPTIGRPIANTVTRILDDHHQLVPIGTPGELYIGGAGVGRGYLNRPDLTAERFVADPWSAHERMYRTGDLVRYRADGAIDYLGRLDHQVKVNGFRIELGEIETVLSRHPAVRQSVVVARAGVDANAGPALVAYVVPSHDTSSLGADASRIGYWQSVWDETYQRSLETDGARDPRFRIAGWNDSYTGQPIPAPQMLEWLERTVERIRALAPRRILEIGCGTGMILYRLIAEVERYAGVDMSREALASIRRELTAAELSKVTLLEQSAEALSGVPDRAWDVVVINSVAQYFPNADYLVRVLRRASELVVDGGHIFIGDVRSLEHLDLLHTAIDVQQAPGHLGCDAVRASVERRVSRESELVLSARFFEAAVRELPRLTHVDVELKRGAARNELTTFRYDVVLTVGPKGAPAEPGPVTGVAAQSLDEIRALIADAPASVYLSDIPNARLSGVAAVHREMREGATATVEALRRCLNVPEVGVDPEDVFALSDVYEAHVRWAHSGDPTRFDAVLRHKSHGKRMGWPSEPTSIGAPAEYANVPARVSDDDALASDLRKHLRLSVPEYMVPTSFVVMDALPLTPNGKIDRNALPAPASRLAAVATPYAPPTNDLERQIAQIWQELLAVERVGRQDNFFDLGANSLLTMQANGRLGAVLGRKVSLVSMFRYPTVQSLAAHLAENGQGATAPTNEARSRDRATRAEQAATRRRALRAEQKR
jgi:natural product biosynthesis luciferase-like monooxygenase protein